MKINLLLLSLFLAAEITAQTNHLLPVKQNGKYGFINTDGVLIIPAIYEAAGKFEKNGLSGRKGEDCGGGKVFLRKVTTSDFYVEPFLRNRIKTDSVNIITGSPVIKKPSVTKKTIPLSKAPVKKNPPVVTKKTKPTVSPNTNNSLTRTNTPAKQIIDSVKKIDVPVAKEDPIKSIFTIPEVLKNRENALIKTLVVNDEDVTVKLYDNGIVDGDTISVYLDKKLLLSKKGLSEKPIVMHLKMDEDNTEHELVMVAENLGSIPPNTSVMIVEAGEQRYSVYIESTEKKNAVVRFKYQKSK